MTFPFHGMISQGTITPEQFIQDIRIAGATGIETMWGWEDKDPVNWKKLIDAAKAAGLKQACYDIGLNLVYTTQEEKNNLLAKCRERLAFARNVLDCSTVLIYSSKPAPDMPIPEAVKIFGDMLNEASIIAAEYGITVTLEDFDPLPAFVCSAKSCMDVLARAPKAGLTFDTGNFLIADDNPVEIFPLVKERIAHVHVKEKACVQPDDKPAQTSLKGLKYRGAFLGKGSAQIAECTALLKESGYKGWLSVETGASLPEAINGIKFLCERI